MKKYREKFGVDFGPRLEVFASEMRGDGQLEMVCQARHWLVPAWFFDRYFDPVPDAVKTCSSCRHFYRMGQYNPILHGDPTVDNGGCGQCRFRAPHVGTCSSGWPVVRLNDYCGEYKEV